MSRRLRIPISSTARQYGYLSWPSALDEEVRRVLGDLDAVEVILEGPGGLPLPLPPDTRYSRVRSKKRVAWQYRRISVGQARLRAAVAGASEFYLRMGKPGVLHVVCK